MSSARINLKSIDYFKFRKLVIDGNRDDYGACAKEVKALCDGVQTLKFRDEEFDDESDRSRFSEICLYYKQILHGKRIDPTDVRIKSGWWGDHKNAYSAGKLKPAVLKDALLAKAKEWAKRQGCSDAKVNKLGSQIDGPGLYVFKHRDHQCFQYVGRADNIFAACAEKMRLSFTGACQEPLAALFIISMSNDWDFYFTPVSGHDDDNVLRILENDLILKHDSIWPHGLNFVLHIESLLEVSEFRKSCVRHHWPPRSDAVDEVLNLEKLRAQVAGGNSQLDGSRPATPSSRSRPESVEGATASPAPPAATQPETLSPRMARTRAGSQVEMPGVRRPRMARASIGSVDKPNKKKPVAASSGDKKTRAKKAIEIPWNPGPYSPDQTPDEEKPDAAERPPSPLLVGGVSPYTVEWVTKTTEAMSSAVSESSDKTFVVKQERDGSPDSQHSDRTYVKPATADSSVKPPVVTPGTTSKPTAKGTPTRTPRKTPTSGANVRPTSTGKQTPRKSAGGPMTRSANGTPSKQQMATCPLSASAPSTSSLIDDPDVNTKSPAKSAKGRKPATPKGTARPKSAEVKSADNLQAAKSLGATSSASTDSLHKKIQTDDVMVTPIPDPEPAGQEEDSPKSETEAEVAVDTNGVEVTVETDDAQNGSKDEVECIALDSSTENIDPEMDADLKMATTTGSDNEMSKSLDSDGLKKATTGIPKPLATSPRLSAKNKGTKSHLPVMATSGQSPRR